MSLPGTGWQVPGRLAMAGRHGLFAWRERQARRDSKSLAGACPVKFAKATVKRISLGPSHVGSMELQGVGHKIL